MKKLKITKVLLSLIIVLLLIFILTYFGISIYKLIIQPTNTVVVENGKIFSTQNFEAYIIRNEEVLNDENYKNGIIKIKEEGQRVAKDENIYRYYNKKEEELVKKIEELSIEIQKILDKESAIPSSDITILEKQIEEKFKNIAKLNNNEEILQIKNDIDNIINKKAQISGELSPAGSNLRKLIEEKANYEKELNAGEEYVKAHRAGLVSYKIDNLEKIFTTKDFSYLTKDFLDNLKLKTGKIIESSEENAKIVDNFEYYLAIVLKEIDREKVAVGKKIKVQLFDRQENAVVEYINENEKIVVIKLQNKIENMLDIRKTSIEIIWWSEEGIKVPNSAIIYKYDRAFAIRNRAGYLNVIPVNVLKSNANYSIIDNYTTAELKELNYNEEEIKNLKKITLYDEIILYPTQDMLQ